MCWKEPLRKGWQEEPLEGPDLSEPVVSSLFSVWVLLSLNEGTTVCHLPDIV